MSTFLQICQAVRQECGISGSGPTTVSGQTGEMKRIVDWVQASYRDVQLRSPLWLWMRKGFSFNCTIGQKVYSATDAGIADFASWCLEHLRVYSGSLSNEYSLTYMAYDDFREVYMRGVIPTGKPTFFTITPDKSLHFYPTPNDTYTIYGDYYKELDVLSGDADVPEFPGRFHELLVYRAMMKYGAYEAASEVFQYASAEYNRLMRDMEQDQLADMPTPEPLV